MAFGVSQVIGEGAHHWWVLQNCHPWAPHNFQRPNFGSQLEGFLSSREAKFLALRTLEEVNNSLDYQGWGPNG